MKTGPWIAAACVALAATVAAPAVARTIVLVAPNAIFDVVYDNVPQGKQRGPFGSGGTCPLQAKAKSPWPPEVQLDLLKKFKVPAGAHHVKVHLAINNGAYILVNGFDVGIGFNGHEGCAEDNDVIADGFDDYLRPTGYNNDLAVYADNRGGEAFVGVRITAEIDDE